ncbi:glucosamine 6-phosphate N-acetyltransferase [Cavenderia fasciculata]|uniref:Glucosamine 6-phosphate N-acetyltransferase n=1 Tax=Cavenderia fasciculata TaxID=261658 RepID=F4PWH4_CACFS|nr:glucosamine 6-phosphate N-acetyltransferase [Cavenderia fasciculata]EGG20338.1 glucosamine 6-phosphate N-acetyltransferase [Cavenderia fasciculata]|eukprot:XP_004367321.1 glucosamine 6-phosphate N-acetyltransferase [Cavenderia fasciculata]
MESNECSSISNNNIICSNNNNNGLFPLSMMNTTRYYNDGDIQFRPLEIDDYDKGYSALLCQLTEAKFTKSQYIERYNQMKKELDNYYVVVVEDKSKSKIIGTGTLMVEKKFIRGCALCGHIEDIVVDSTYRGKNLGLKMIEQLKYIGTLVGCYKLILDCDENNVKFYEKCGFVKKQAMMALYLPPQPKL